MILPARPSAFVIFAAALLSLSLVGSAPHSVENSRQAKSTENAQISHSQPAPSGPVPAEDGRAPQGQAEAARSYQVRSVAASQLGAPRDATDDEDLFKDMDAKALATILLQALKVGGENAESEESKGGNRVGLPFIYQGFPQKDVDENVKSATRVVKTQRRDPSQNGDSDEDSENTLAPRNLESLLQDLEKFSSATKRERSNAADMAHHRTQSEESKENDVLRKLSALEEMVERKQGYSDYEDNAEDGRDRTGYRGQDRGEEVGRKNREDQASNVASELLLKYLLKEESSQEEEPRLEEEVKKNSEESEQEVDSTSEEKRSDEDNDIDPQTIDRLIEISSKLHLPADDVIDIINDVEKKRKDSMEKVESRHGGGARHKFRPELREEHSLMPRYREERPRHHPNSDLTLQDLLSAENALDYEGMSLPIPRRYGPGQNSYPNYIRPRTYLQRHRPYYYQPVFRNEDYYDDESQDKEELENYIEKILLKHPEVFQ
ncbi:neurosecretory protein VGF-like [Narcine bancroftii]|uniref:neurosecretory protein VGF-like n=1 Tax=Narcine bancroftii TaxID=1343680 RepID=UPI0038311A8D